MLQVTCQKDIPLKHPLALGAAAFDGPAGDLCMLLTDCRIIYGDPREAAPQDREEAEVTTVSALLRTSAAPGSPADLTSRILVRLWWATGRSESASNEELRF